MEGSMNVLAIIRAKQTREQRVKAAQKATLCYRGIAYDRKKVPAYV